MALHIAVFELNISVIISLVLLFPIKMLVSYKRYSYKPQSPFSKGSLLTSFSLPVKRKARVGKSSVRVCVFILYVRMRLLLCTMRDSGICVLSAPVDMLQLLDYSHQPELKGRAASHYIKRHARTYTNRQISVSKETRVLPGGEML